MCYNQIIEIQATIYKKGDSIMTLKEIRKDINPRYADDDIMSLADFIRNRGEKNTDEIQFIDDDATKYAVYLIQLIDNALRTAIKDREHGGSIYICYSRGKIKTVFDECYILYEVVPDKFVQYFSQKDESYLLFYVGDTNNDKTFYIKTCGLSIEETVIKMVDNWKEAMKKLYLLFNEMTLITE